MLELLFATGMRVSELCALQCEDVRLDEGEVKIFWGEYTKFYIYAMIGKKSMFFAKKRGMPSHRAGILTLPQASTAKRGAYYVRPFGWEVIKKGGGVDVSIYNLS